MKRGKKNTYGVIAVIFTFCLLLLLKGNSMSIVNAESVTENKVDLIIGGEDGLKIPEKTHIQDKLLTDTSDKYYVVRINGSEDNVIDTSRGDNGLKFGQLFTQDNDGKKEYFSDEHFLNSPQDFYRKVKIYLKKDIDVVNINNVTTNESFTLLAKDSKENSLTVLQRILVFGKSLKPWAVEISPVVFKSGEQINNDEINKRTTIKFIDTSNRVQKYNWVVGKIASTRLLLPDAWEYYDNPIDASNPTPTGTELFKEIEDTTPSGKYYLKRQFVEGKMGLFEQSVNLTNPPNKVIWYYAQQIIVSEPITISSPSLSFQTGSSTESEKLTDEESFSILDRKKEKRAYSDVDIYPEYYRSPAGALNQDENELASEAVTDDGKSFNEPNDYYRLVTIVPENLTIGEFESNDKDLVRMNDDGTIAYAQKISVTKKSSTNENTSGGNSTTSSSHHKPQWTYFDNSGVVLTKRIKSYYSLFNKENIKVDNRALAKSTYWVTDQYRVNNYTGIKQYHVATNEWINSADVLFIESLKNIVNVDGTKNYYQLYDIAKNSKSNRALDSYTSWKTDKRASDDEGNSYYRVATDEWVEQDNGVKLDYYAKYIN